MFTLICCSLAGLKMSLRMGFCCRNVLAQDKIKVRRKLCCSSCSEIDYVTGSCMHAIMLSCINLSSLATMHVALPHDKATYMLCRISFFPSRAATFIVCSAFGRFSQFLKDLVKLVALCTKPLNPKNNLAMEDQHGVVHISEVNTKYLSIASMISCKQLHQPVE